jgi:hypothetical protein
MPNILLTDHSCQTILGQLSFDSCIKFTQNIYKETMDSISFTRTTRQLRHLPGKGSYTEKSALSCLDQPQGLRTHPRATPSFSPCTEPGRESGLHTTNKTTKNKQLLIKKKENREKKEIKHTAAVGGR